MSRFPKVRIEDMFPQYEVPAHQVLLSFNTDNNAADFQAWLDEEGFNAFRKWQQAMKLDSEDREES